MGAPALAREALPMMSTAPSARTTSARDWHTRQRDLVAASLRAVPAKSRSTHRRWA
jgi:hypothetical protein